MEAKAQQVRNRLLELSFQCYRIALEMPEDRLSRMDVIFAVVETRRKK